MAGRSRFPAAGPHNSPAEEANPFSFKEFVRSKNQSPASADAPAIPGGSSGSSASPKGSSRFSLLEANSSSSPESPALNLGFQESFFPDPPTATRSLLEEEEEGDEDDEDEEEEDWSSSYQPSAVEEAHPLARTPQASLSSSFDTYYPSDSPQLPAFSPWQLREAEGGLLLEGGEGSSPLAGRGAPRDPRFYPPPQPTYEELKEENAKLRSQIGQVQALSGAQAERVKELEKVVEERKRKEEKEARDLEAVTLQVEENLRLMTKRAMKAESGLLKMKQENALLQVQVRNYRLENEALKSGHLANLAVVKQNADAALQNLLAVITKSRVSVKQLVSGAEELQMVAGLLKSIDKISELPQDSP